MTVTRNSERVLSEIEAGRAELLAAISEAVRIDSVNPRYPGQVYDEVVGGEGRVSRFVAEIYEGLGAEVDVFALEPGRDNAVGVVRGTGGGRSLIYNGHVDVVPPGPAENWTHGDQFSGHNDGERIWGRGSTDMKAGVLAQAFAARALQRAGVRLRGDLILEAVVGEECMNNDIGVSATVSRGYRADAAVVSEPTTAGRPLAVMPTSAGQLWFTLSVQGKVTHAANRGRTLHPVQGEQPPGVSAIDKGFVVYEGLRRLEQQWAFSKHHPLYRPGHFTIMPGILEGGTTGVQFPLFVPEFMRTEYLLWYPPGDDHEAIMRRGRGARPRGRRDRRLAARAPARDRLAAALAGQLRPGRRDHRCDVSRARAGRRRHPLRRTRRGRGFPRRRRRVVAVARGDPGDQLRSREPRGGARRRRVRRDRRGHVRDPCVRAAGDAVVRRRGLAASEATGKRPTRTLPREAWGVSHV